ncbi:hypothetical protein ACFL0T_00945 [Candidatus Omnitrophota bacterium]
MNKKPLLIIFTLVFAINSAMQGCVWTAASAQRCTLRPISARISNPGFSDAKTSSAGGASAVVDELPGACWKRAVYKAQEKNRLHFFKEPDFYVQYDEGGTAEEVIDVIYLLAPWLDEDREKDLHHAVTLVAQSVGGLNKDGRRKVIFDFLVTPMPYLEDKAKLATKAQQYVGNMELHFDKAWRLKGCNHIGINFTLQKKFPWLFDSLKRWVASQIGKKFDEANSTFPIFTDEKELEVQRYLHPLLGVEAGGKVKAAMKEVTSKGILAMPLLMSALGVDFLSTEYIEDAIVKIGPVAFPYLLEGLKDDNEILRGNILKIMHKLDHDAVALLNNAMQDRELRVYAMPILQAIAPVEPTMFTISSIADISALPLPEEGEFPERTVVIYGGLSAVMRRFYKDSVDALAKRYNIRLVCIDLADPEAANQTIEEEGLPYEDYIQVPPASPLDEEAGELLKDLVRSQPAGVIILTRPDTHLDIVRWVLGQNEKGHRMRVSVEKPITMPDEVAAIRGLHEQSRDTIFAIDSFFEGISAIEGLRLLCNGQFGRLEGVHARMIEDGVVEPGREWLMDPKKSGGGLGMDMMPHLVALVEMMLEVFRSVRGADKGAEASRPSLSNMQIHPDKTYFSRCEGAPGTTETYARVIGDINGVGVDLGAGKYTHEMAFYIVLKGSNADLEIRVGTRKTPSVLEMRAKDGTLLYRQDYGIGISDRSIGIVRRAFDMAQDLGNVTGPELDFRVAATTIGVELLDRAARVADGYYQRYPAGADPDSAPIIPDPGIPKFPDIPRLLIQNLKKPSQVVVVAQSESTSSENSYCYIVKNPNMGILHDFYFKLHRDRLEVINPIGFLGSVDSEHNIVDDGVVLTFFNWLLSVAKELYPGSRMPLVFDLVDGLQMLEIADDLFDPETVEIWQPVEDRWYRMRDPDINIYGRLPVLQVGGFCSDPLSQDLIIGRRDGKYIVLMKPDQVDVTMNGHMPVVTDRATGRRVYRAMFERMDFNLRGVPSEEARKPVVAPVAVPRGELSWLSLLMSDRISNQIDACA